MTSLDGRRVVITGGLGSLGRAVAELALLAGGKVACLDRVASTGAPAGAASITDVNLSDPVAAVQALDRAVEALGGVDILVNAAGAFDWQTLSEGDVHGWTELFEANVLSAVHATKAALPHLVASPAGRVVMVGAAAAVRAGAGLGPYAAAKSGVHRLTESLAEELKATRVTVNAVLPSILDTPANRVAMPEADTSSWVKPRELAEVILFLASDAGAPITGALLPVTGRA